MKHFDHCQCSQCRRERKRPQAACGYLMQQIISHGKAHLPCKRFYLTLSPLPRILVPPLRISAVQVGGEPVVSEESAACCGEVQITIPLSVLVCDQRGQTHTAQSSITVSVCLRSAHWYEDAFWLAKALVRLCQSPVCFEDAAQVAVCLDVCAQVYLVRMQAMYAPSPCEASCAELPPLFPQPCPPPCR